MALSIAEVWHIYGIVTQNGIPVNNAKIRAYDRRNNTDSYLGETGLDSSGHFTITYSRWNFQQGNQDITNPLVIIRVIDYQERIVWESSLLTDVTSEYTYNIDLTSSHPVLPWIIYGTVSAGDELIRTGSVKVCDLYNGSEYLLVSCIIGNDGTYRGEYYYSQFQHDSSLRDYPQLTLKVYNDTGSLIGQAVVPSPPSSSQRFDINLQTSDTSYRISGQILNKTGAPVNGLEVEVKSIFSADGEFKENVLEPVFTTGTGNYLKTYSSSEARAGQSGNSPINLVVTVRKISGTTKIVLAKSNLIVNAGSEEVYNFTIDTPSNSNLSGYVQNTDILTGAGFSEQQITNMAGKPELIEYAVAVTGLSIEDIQAIVTAKAVFNDLKSRIGTSSNLVNYITEEIIYAFVKTKNANSADELIGISPDNFHSILIFAVTKSIIGPQNQQNLGSITTEWSNIVKELLKNRDIRLPSGVIINYAGLPDEAAEIVYRNYARYSHDMNSFWNALQLIAEKDHGPLNQEHLTRLKLYFDIYDFADEFMPVVEGMNSYLYSNDFKALSDFTKVDRADWDDILSRSSSINNPMTVWPENIPGETLGEKKSNLALILFRKIIELFPMERFRNELKKETDSEWSDVKKYITVDHIEFDFKNPITQVSVDSPEYVLNEKLLTIQRLYNLTPKYTVIKKLMAEGFASAMSIAQINADEFAARFSDITGGVDDAYTLHETAVHTASQALFIMGTYNQQSDFQGDSLPAVTDKIIIKENEPESLPRAMTSALSRESATSVTLSTEVKTKQVFPNIATLFGNQNHCKCEECQSIFSPSAYTTDLLEFMEEPIREILFSRRPDLGETELSCRNTNGVVSYIDFVNEILENAVSPRAFYIFDDDVGTFERFLNDFSLKYCDGVSDVITNQFLKKGLPLDKNFYVQNEGGFYIVGDHWRYKVKEVTVKNYTLPQKTFLILPFPQTGKDSDMRRIRPEHVNHNAYDILKYPKYPAILPFNLPFVEINKYLELRECKRYQLYSALHKETEVFVLGNEQLRNYFEITEQQLEIINKDVERPWELWGLEEFESDFSLPAIDLTINGKCHWTYLVSNVAVFLQRTGLSYEELLDLLSTGTINGFGNLSMEWIDADGDEADLRKLWIEYNNAKPSSNANNNLASSFTTIARFIRFYKHIKSDIFTTDRLLKMVCNYAPFDNLNAFYKVMRTAKEFRVSPYQAAAWYTGKLDNINIKRGPQCQLEQIFISQVDSADRIAVWKKLINNLSNDIFGTFVVGQESNKQDGDIRTLLAGLNIKYDELSQIVYEEFVLRDEIYIPEGTVSDAWGILPFVDFSMVNLGKIYRAADVSKTLEISVKDYYKLLDIIQSSRHASYTFNIQLLYNLRDAAGKLKEYRITADELDYLLTNSGRKFIPWIITKNNELGTITSLNQEINRINNSEDTDSVQTAIENAVINKLASLGKISADTAAILLKDILLSSDSETSKLNEIIEICSGGWNTRFFSQRAIHDRFLINGSYNITPVINIVSGSTNEKEQLPDGALAAQWKTVLFVTKDDDYKFITQIGLVSEENLKKPDLTISELFWTYNEDSGEYLENREQLEISEENSIRLSKGKFYEVCLNWILDESEEDASGLNLSFLWQNLHSKDSPCLLGTENTILKTDISIDLFVKSCFIVRQIGIDANQLSYLGSHDLELGIFNFNEMEIVDGSVIPWSKFSNLCDIFTLNKELVFKNQNTTLFDVWEESYKYTNISAFVKYIAQETGWWDKDIEYFRYSIAQFRTPYVWKLLSKAMNLLNKVGLSAKFGDEILTGNNSLAQSEQLRSLIQTKYSKSQWIEVLEPIQDSLRLIQRDALCAYLLSKRKMFTEADNGFTLKNLIQLLNYKLGSSIDVEETENYSSVSAYVYQLRQLNDLLPPKGTSVSDWNKIMDEQTWDVLDERKGYINNAAIYARYLIDVEMGSDVKTIRIVQANNSIQMLMQRAVLNLEPQIKLNEQIGDKIKHQWPWMKNYRLWEANRKIFIYPENWLEPELRDDRTPLFKDIETAFLQKELTKETVENALKNYVSGLSDISNLEVIGSYEESSESEKILHVVARTYHSPHTFYYRCNHDINGGKDYWTPWEKVDLDITADVVIPVPFCNKLYLFWPLIELKEQTIEDTDCDMSKESKFKDSFKYFEVKLAWSEYSNGNWSAKRISQTICINDIIGIENTIVNLNDLFHIKANVETEKISIAVYTSANVNEEIIERATKLIESINAKIEKIKNIVSFKSYKEYLTRILTKQKTYLNSFLTNAKKITQRATFYFGGNNNAKLEITDGSNIIILDDLGTFPEGTIIQHNCVIESKKNQLSVNSGALKYPKGNILLNRTPDRFRIFPTNLSFFDNKSDRLKPFFFHENNECFIIKPDPISKSFVGRLISKLTSNSYHRIENFYHPLANELLRKANYYSINELFTRSVQTNTADQNPIGYFIAGDNKSLDDGNRLFNDKYLPQKSIRGQYPFPVIDFSQDSPYGTYNWELFFHLPFFIANRLSSDLRFEEAMKWFNFIFNPANVFTEYEQGKKWSADLPAGARFWNFIPFFANRGVQDSIYKAIDQKGEDDKETELGRLIEEWKNDPFKPHLIARVRIAAYQKAVIMKYLDNLINWGDSLFRLDNMESINEATQLYTYASEVLGDKPKIIPATHDSVGLTYSQLKANYLDGFSNSIIKLENYIPPAPPEKVKLWKTRKKVVSYNRYNYNYGYNYTIESVPQRSIQLLRIAPAMHYFCIPKNDKLLSYWEKVEDRLFKIRNSLNIDGVKRFIPLFAPPIDPGLLARAAAAGIDIGTLLRDAQAPSAPYRFSVMMPKAIELCNEVKAFGSALLLALEKKDAEKIALLRNTHEIEINKLIKEIKQNAIKEAQNSLESLKKSKEMAEQRYQYYKNIEKINPMEKAQLALMVNAGVLNTVGQAMTMSAAGVKLIPDFIVGALVGLGGGAIGLSKVGGGEKSGGALHDVGSALTLMAGILDRAANITGTYASYQRRWNDWKLQESLAQKEMQQLDKQILAAEIRLNISELDLRNHEKQIEQAQEIKEVMESKFTNEKLYQWMIDQLNMTYSRIYDIAYQVAKKAEKAYQFELGIRNTSFINPEYWDSAKKGLLAGERLMTSLRQMDTAFLENNKREFEITKHISLKSLAPGEVLKLRETGICEIDIPEELFDFDLPGQYFRRIKTVRVTIPCITGPYTSINARLTLSSAKLRFSKELDNGEYIQNDKFVMSQDSVSPMSIATSNAQMDSGLFEFNFRDERYLPFEGAGAIGKWKLELPQDFRQFDYATISDVILHLSYTARESNSLSFKNAVIKHLKETLKDIKFIPNLISLKQNFSSQYNAIISNLASTIVLDNKNIPQLAFNLLKINPDSKPVMDNVKAYVVLKEKVDDGSVINLKINDFNHSSISNFIVSDKNNDQNRFGGRIWEIAYEDLNGTEMFPEEGFEFGGLSGLEDKVEDIYFFFNSATE